MTAPQLASGLFYKAEDDGLFRLHPIDGNGVVFAVANIPRFGAEQLMDYLQDAYGTGDTIGEVAGHA